MMYDNKRFEEFVSQLNAKGVTHHWMWQARRDGAKPSWPKKPADVGMIAFTGDGFQPSVLVAVVIEYETDGFGLFIDGPSNSIAADVERIATPNRGYQPRACAQPVPDMGQSICTKPDGHEGPHRCSAADVDARA